MTKFLIEIIKWRNTCRHKLVVEFCGYYFSIFLLFKKKLSTFDICQKVLHVDVYMCTHAWHCSEETCHDWKTWHAHTSVEHWPMTIGRSESVWRLTECLRTRPEVFMALSFVQPLAEFSYIGDRMQDKLRNKAEKVWASLSTHTQLLIYEWAMKNSVLFHR